MKYDEQIEKILNSLTLDEMIGQMFCWNLGNRSHEEIERIAKKIKPGGLFVSNKTPEHIKKITDLMNDNLKIPVIVAADIEAGPGHILRGETQLPAPMAWGATDDAELIKNAHRATAQRCREMGVHWSFSPIVDINYNKDNPVTNTRAVSDVPEKVAKICCAAVEGLQENGLVMAGSKHFPGDGMDDRNQHFCTTINSMSKEEWMDTYGYVYKKMFEAGTASVMVGHIALPAYDEKLNEEYGYPPATLSYNLITKLLKEELGFEGCVVSDGFKMIGIVSCCPKQSEAAVEFVKAGGDIMLMPGEEVFDAIKQAVETGEITIERIKDAVRRVLMMKKNARLFENQENVLNSVAEKLDIKLFAEEIGEKSLTLVRNFQNVLPLHLEKGSKILLLNLKRNKEKEDRHYSADLDYIEEELKNRGYEVKTFVNGMISEFADILYDYDLVLVNCKFGAADSPGGTMRVGWEQMMTFWTGELLNHPKVVFTSFGCPYKLYEFPYLKTYINAYSTAESTQKAFIKAIFGEIPFIGKSPVSLEGFFEAE